MSNARESGWFYKIRDDSSKGNEVCYAESADAAREFFGYPAVDIEVVRLTWNQLSELTGCVINPDANPEAYAENYMFFNNDGKAAVLWVVE